MGMTRPLPLNVVTYATGPHQGHGRMMNSFIRKGGIAPIVLGWGNQHSWKDRTLCLYEWCKSHPARAVMHVDGYDTCCVREVPEEMNIGESVIFGSEANCWPRPSLSRFFPPAKARYRYINGGTWIANTDSFVSLVDGFNLMADTRVDQEYFTTSYLTYRSNIEIDTECKVFHNLYGAEDDWEIISGEYRVKSTGSFPLVVHGNGRSDIASVWDAFSV